MTSSILPERFTSTSAPKTYTREVPLAFNGYAAVAQPAALMRADEVQAGDILLLDAYVSLVHSVDLVQVPYGATEAIWIRGDLNIIRFAHELVSVLRRSQH